MTDQVKHLLGGYATGTLTPEENAALMRAALEDQELFNALANDEMLRRYLADTAFRKDLLKGTTPKPTRSRWLTALSAAAACLFAAFLWTTQHSHRPTREIALSTQPTFAPNPVAAQPTKTETAKPPTRSKAKVAIARQSDADAVSEAKAAAQAAPVGSAFAPRSVQSFAAPRPASLTRTPVAAKISDVTATILTIDAGSSSGIRVDDKLEVLHDNSPIGLLTITTVEPTFSVGTYSGVKAPEIGDAAVTPKK
jgi:hypothetical protein